MRVQLKESPAYEPPPTLDAHPPDGRATLKPQVRSKEFENLVLEYLGMLYAVALHLTRNQTDAQDLTQNTLVKALRFHYQFKEGSYIKAWLLTIMRNTFINDYRRLARRPVFVELFGTEAAPQTAPDPEVPFTPAVENSGDLLELLDDEVKGALLALPEDFRSAVIMADLRDKSYKEIAQAMDCPIGTVMSRIYRGRKLLRMRLSNYAKNRRLFPTKAGTVQPAPNTQRGNKTERAKVLA